MTSFQPTHLGQANSDVTYPCSRPKLSPELSRLTYNKLVLINAAESINDLPVPPGNRLEKLAGDRAGRYSVRVNDQWRICFTWTASGAGNVQLVDYH